MTNLVQFPGLGLSFELDRVAFSIGGMNIYWYGVCIAVGMCLALVFAFRHSVEFGVDADAMVDVILIGVVMGILCARLYYVALSPYQYHSLKDVLAIRDGGLAIYGGIIGGVFSATEGSAIAVVYALVLAFCYRSINLKSLWKIIVDSAKMSGMVVFLVGVSNILGWVMAFLQIPDAVAAALLSLTSNKYIILLIMNVILLVSGTFMDVTPAILIFTPLFLPICQSFGMSTIQFGLILVYNLCIGNDDKRKE